MSEFKKIGLYVGDDDGEIRLREFDVSPTGEIIGTNQSTIVFNSLQVAYIQWLIDKAVAKAMRELAHSLEEAAF